MMPFTNLKLITSDDLIIPYNYTASDRPYNILYERKKAGKSWRDPPSRIIKIAWQFENKRKEINLANFLHGLLDQTADFFIAVIHFSDSTYAPPNNAIVINPDATLNHQIMVPRLMRKGHYDSESKRWIEPPPGIGEDVQLPEDDHLGVAIADGSVVYRIEGIWDIDIKDGRTRIHLIFNYEWCEIRYYDPATRQWQERDGIYRQ